MADHSVDWRIVNEQWAERYRLEKKRHAREINEILSDLAGIAGEALAVEGVTSWGDGGRLGDALLGIKDACESFRKKEDG